MFDGSCLPCSQLTNLACGKLWSMFLVIGKRLDFQEVTRRLQLSFLVAYFASLCGLLLKKYVHD